MPAVGRRQPRTARPTAGPSGHRRSSTRGPPPPCRAADRNALRVLRRRGCGAVVVARRDAAGVDGPGEGGHRVVEDGCGAADAQPVPWWRHAPAGELLRHIVRIRAWPRRGSATGRRAEEESVSACSQMNWAAHPPALRRRSQGLIEPEACQKIQSALETGPVPAGSSAKQRSRGTLTLLHLGLVPCGGPVAPLASCCTADTGMHARSWASSGVEGGSDASVPVFFATHTAFLAPTRARGRPPTDFACTLVTGTLYCVSECAWAAALARWGDHSNGG